MVVARFHLNFQSYFAFVREFDGVPDQVHEDLAQSPGISPHNLGDLRGHLAQEFQTFFVGRIASVFKLVSRQSRRLKSPASIFEKPRMSLMTVSNESADIFTVSRYSRCSGISCVSSARSVMPITPFKGVRISWLILARNSPFARLAASAASFALTNSVSACFRTMYWPICVPSAAPRSSKSWSGLQTARLYSSRNPLISSI